MNRHKPWRLATGPARPGRRTGSVTPRRTRSLSARHRQRAHPCRSARLAPRSRRRHQAERASSMSETASVPTPTGGPAFIGWRRSAAPERTSSNEQD